MIYRCCALLLPCTNAANMQDGFVYAYCLLLQAAALHVALTVQIGNGHCNSSPSFMITGRIWLVLHDTVFTLQATIAQLMQEWRLGDFAVAESIFKSRQRQLKQNGGAQMRQKMQVCWNSTMPYHSHTLK